METQADGNCAHQTRGCPTSTGRGCERTFVSTGSNAPTLDGRKTARSTAAYDQFASIAVSVRNSRRLRAYRASFLLQGLMPPRRNADPSGTPISVMATSVRSTALRWRRPPKQVSCLRHGDNRSTAADCFPGCLGGCVPQAACLGGHLHGHDETVGERRASSPSTVTQPRHIAAPGGLWY